MNLLGTPRGRLGLFGLLYFGEGLPQGFVTTAVALEFKRLGMEAEALGAFLATAMSPWAWKWLFGPIVDNVHVSRFGRRAQWIVLAQLGMIVGLAVALVNFPTAGTDGAIVGLGLFTACLVLHNVAGALQDVAIDALAVSVLPEAERGRANGVMFACAQLGMAAGGSGVVALKAGLGFGGAALLVPGLLFVILAAVVRGVREAPAPRGTGGGLRAAGREVGAYLRTVLRVFFTTRRGFLGFVLALLPAGCMALSLTLSTVIAPTLGMRDDEIARLGVLSSLTFAVACLAGGVVSDRFGRRRALALMAGSTALPTLWMAWQFQSAGWLHAPPPIADGTWPRAEAMISAWWVASLCFSAFYGMMYGVRSALYMDIAEPEIAATQFTASMALLNVGMMFSYWWQGKALSAVAEGGWGLTVPQALGVDVGIGLLFLLVLPFVDPRRVTPAAGVMEG
jgi:PAT family beta-lactamase induction signal transducer AmpG